MNEAATLRGPANPMLPVMVRVTDFRRETADTFTLTLDLAGAGGSGVCRPGQFNMLYVFGVGEVPISVSGDTSRTGAVVHTIRAVGAVTNALARLRPGDWVGVRGPMGSAWPLEAARGHDLVLVSGGIGLAPLRPVLYHVLGHRGDYGRVTLLQGARTPADLLYLEELRAWQRAGGLRVLLTVDRADASWEGRIGLVTALFPGVEFDPARTVGLTCGPEVMMRFAVLELQQRGIADERLYVSLERNMQCAIGLCGHCQFGPSFVCMDGPVFRYDRVRPFFHLREV
jgi:NAD(P)H-flavin reductase